MTSARQDHPSTALDLLFGPGQDAAAALAHELLSVDNGSLGRALANFPKATCEAAVREASAQASQLLDVDLIGLLVAGWRTQHDLTAAARHTLARPGHTELVDLATHQITMTAEPSVTILVDGRRVATLRLGLSIVFDISALGAEIKAGRLVGLHSGRCDITATLALQGADALTESAHLELPGVLLVSPGIRLLPAQSYPAGAEPADSAQRVSASW